MTRTLRELFRDAVDTWGDFVLGFVAMMMLAGLVTAVVMATRCLG